ncbi:ABC transporter permease [Bosea minatitlanensis]|uniref:Glutathione transport system permease protein GsiD n=1 Tax=Bosea minatitlanensis TaxID=128782 RepID=A0ABW0F4H0_9HYPH|nr:ABC transporter permease [Bosea minatitlanensis]MCT4494162.1 ABC transporter permease [Bosea minatitlanensis]
MTQANSTDTPHPAWREKLALLTESKTAVFGLVVVGLLLFVAIFAPLLAPYAADDFTDTVLSGPTISHPMGVDQLGRDVFSRVILGARISLQIGLEAVSIALVFGVALGMVAGFYGGRIDALIMRLMDIMMALPYILLAVLIAAVLGPSLQNGIIAIGIVRIPRFARLARAQTLATMQLPFIEASRCIGSSSTRIMFKDLLPNIIGPISVYCTLSLGEAILGAAVLSFLGLGAQPPTPEWGAMLYEAQRYVTTAPLLSIFPGLAIFITVLAFNLLGDALRDILDPKSKR